MSIALSFFLLWVGLGLGSTLGYFALDYILDRLVPDYYYRYTHKPKEDSSDVKWYEVAGFFLAITALGPISAFFWLLMAACAIGASISVAKTHTQ